MDSLFYFTIEVVASSTPSFPVFRISFFLFAMYFSTSCFGLIQYKHFEKNSFSSHGHHLQPYSNWWLLLIFCRILTSNVLKNVLDIFGILLLHPEVAPNIWPNFTFVPKCVGIDFLTKVKMKLQCFNTHDILVVLRSILTKIRFVGIGGAPPPGAKKVCLMGW